MKHKTSKTQNTTAEFSAQYRSPLWQKKRLEVLEYDSFRCVICGENEENLHVHHASYIKGRKIWEYETEELLTVCEDCHKKLHDSKDRINSGYLPKLQKEYRGGKYCTRTLELLLEIMCNDDSCEFAKEALDVALKCHYKEKMIKNGIEVLK